MPRTRTRTRILTALVLLLAVVLPVAVSQAARAARPDLVTRATASPAAVAPGGSVATTLRR